MKRKILVVAAVLFTALLQAQNNNSINLDEVTVTATKNPVKQSQTGKVVTIIDEATIQRNIGRSLTELLNTQAGIFITGANNAPGSNQDLYLRGASTGNTLILIDGIPMQDPSQINSNSIDLNNITLNQIERIEILKGAQSTLWGSNATAGVINIITKKNKQKPIEGNALLAYGSYNTFKGSAGIGGTVNKFDYNVSYNHLNSKGFSAAFDTTKTSGFDKDGIVQHNILANAGVRFNPFFSLKYMGQYTNYDADGDNGAFKDDKDYEINSKNIVNSIHLTYNKKNLALNIKQAATVSERMYLDDSTDVHPTAFAKWSRGYYKAQSYITDAYGRYSFTGNISLLAGLQYNHQKYGSDYKSISNYGAYTDTLDIDSVKMNNIAGYASFLITGLNGFNNEIGIRYNHSSEYGNNTTFTINPSYNIDENTRVFLNISSGYKEPSLYQLLSEYRNTNGLDPEKTLNYEIGVQAQSNNQQNSIRIIGFKRDIKDLIIFYTDPDTYASEYRNQDEQHDYGFEVESRIAIGQIGSWNNNLTYVEGTGKDANGNTMNNLYRRPNFTLNSNITFTPTKGLTLTPAFRFVGKRIKNMYDPGVAVQPHYYNIDFYADYQLLQKVRFFIDLRNITNQTYFDVPGYTSRKFNFMTGVNITF
ncbi:MAG: TonB-dependent receptor plug domain-containing protein [Niabella sp.]